MYASQPVCRCLSQLASHTGLQMNSNLIGHQVLDSIGLAPISGGSSSSATGQYQQHQAFMTRGSGGSSRGRGGGSHASSSASTRGGKKAQQAEARQMRLIQSKKQAEQSLLDNMTEFGC